MSSGDILVKGEIPLVNDSGETYDYSYVHADADIDLETTWYYYDTFPLSHTVRTYQKAEKKNAGIPDFCLPIFPWKSAAGEFCGEFAEHDRNGGSENREKGKWSRRGSIPSATLSDRNFALPFYFGYRQKFPFEVQKETYSEHEAKEKASQNYQKFHRNLSEKGLQISENHVTIELNDTSCITKGTLRVIERAVEAQPCEMQKMSDGKETM